MLRCEDSAQHDTLKATVSVILRVFPKNPSYGTGTG